jgi:hypothetical protein
LIKDLTWGHKIKMGIMGWRLRGGQGVTGSRVHEAEVVWGKLALT